MHGAWRQSAGGACRLLSAVVVAITAVACDAEDADLDLLAESVREQGLAADGDPCTTRGDCTSDVCVLGYCQPSTAPAYSLLNPVDLTLGAEKALPAPYRPDTVYCYAFTIASQARVKAQIKRANSSGGIGDARAAVTIMPADEAFFTRRVAWVFGGGNPTADTKLNAGDYIACAEWIVPPESGIYAIKVWSGGAGGAPNDSCLTAQELNSKPSAFTGNWRLHHNNHHPMPIPPCGQIEARGIDEVYKTELAPGEELTVTLLANSGKDGVLYLLDQCPRTYDSCIHAVDDKDGVGLETLVYENTGGATKTYYLIVDQKTQVGATFNLTWSIQ